MALGMDPFSIEAPLDTVAVAQHVGDDCVAMAHGQLQRRGAFLLSHTAAVSSRKGPETQVGTTYGVHEALVGAPAQQQPRDVLVAAEGSLLQRTEAIGLQSQSCK